MGEPGEDSNANGAVAAGGEPGASLIAAAPAELETLSIYDSLLRGVAAGPPSIRIDAEVGPHGKFILQQEIGGGAMGRVFRALDRFLLRDVAIKFILRPEGMKHDDFMALFWQEAHVIARLDQHDNIVRIFDVDRSSYPPFIVMEYLDGQSLEKLLRRGPVTVQTALRIVMGVACGLREAHDKGVFHRDLKPSNIFIQKTGRVKLLDFGLARIRNHLYEASSTRLRLVALHRVPPLASAGTPAYMAPEQWRGEEADATTDLWALGTVLYRLLCNAPPFDGETLAALSARVLSGEAPVAVSRLCPEAPAEVCQLVDRMLRSERSERPSSASEVIAVLASALHVQPPDEAMRSAIAVPPPRAPEGPSPAAAPGRPDDRFAHGSDPDSSLRHWGRILLVLVSGPDSDELFPDRLPEWILRHAGVNCEVLRCPPGQPGDIADSALRLGAALSERFRRPRHIVFVTHGEGTSVVLRMLLDEARRLQSRGRDDLELDVRSPFYRTRHIAVLHPRRGATSAHQVSGLRVDPGLAPLVSEMIAEAEHFRRATLPAPTLHYFGFETGEPLSFDSSAVRSLASLLVQPEMLVARETIAQTFELDCADKIESLVGPSEGGAAGDMQPTVLGAAGVTQLEVFDELLALAQVQHQRPFVIVIAGDTGVGKSTVLRRAARSLGSQFVTGAADDAALPILIPLYFASLTSDHVAALGAEAAQDRRGRVLHDILLDWWCNWFNDITYGGALSVDWVKARLRSEAVMLVLDGVDEFIANHPTLGICDFQQMIAFLGTEYRRNNWLTIVLGVRSTQPGLLSLAPSNIREILRLTTAQAMRQFPATSTWLTTDAPIKTLLFTPLILAQLNTRRPASTQRPSTHGEVILLALTAIIEQSDLSGKLDESGQPTDIQRWIDALTAAAWCVFCRLRGEIATSTLKLDGGELYRSWAEHLERTQQQTQGEQLMAGFHLLCESRACDVLLHRTILYPTGRGEVRFIHREWQDFLAARYLAQVVMYRHVDEFRHVGNTARISRIAGELLCQAGVCIDDAFVIRLLQRAHDTGAQLITANFSALLTNSQVVIEGPAIDSFLSAVDTMPAIARLITLIGLSYRALRGDDATAEDLRHRLVRVFQRYGSRPAAGDGLGVMRSVAWCYQKAFAQRFGGPAPAEAWPGLEDDDERAALAMMSTTVDGRPRVLVEHRSVQMALLDVQQAVVEDPFRPISGVHYLYCLVVARRHGVGIAELGRELPALLAPDSAYAAAIERDPLVPELRDVLAACRRLELARYR